ncbi:hypothetical protein D043_2397B, partial [Vibrio parahaemolyticus EKP-021]
RQLRIHH